MTQNLRQRFEEKIVREADSGCWLWTACKDQCGYGMITVGSKKRGTNRSVRAHRLSYEIYVGPIPDGKQLDHLCRIRHCVNPKHLEPVLQAENIRRGKTGDNMRSKTHCPAGHPYTGDNLLINYRGARICRACHRESARRSRHKMDQRCR